MGKPDRYYVVTELRSWDITDEGMPLRDTDIVDRLNEQDDDLARLKAQIMEYHNRNDELLAALKRMDALMEMLWKAVPWGATFNLNIMELNEAPIQAKQAIANATQPTK